MPLSSSDARYSGGDGSSPEEAVVIRAPDKPTGIRAEYLWLEDRFGTRGEDWTHRSQDLAFHDELGPMDAHFIAVNRESPYRPDIVQVWFALEDWFYDGA